jgi:hypothetical protein
LGDLRLNPPAHLVCLDGVCAADRDGKDLMFPSWRLVPKLDLTKSP